MGRCVGNPRPDLTVAVLSGIAGAEVRANAAALGAELVAAARAGAQVVVAPECALVGYPGAVRAGLAGIDWCAVAEHEDALLMTAERLGVLFVFGSAGPVGNGHGNLAVAGGVAAPVRYAKRFLTPLDAQHFVPGKAAATITAFGWCFGLGICFDLRFPAHWSALAAAGADAFLVPSHMAGADPDPGTKAVVIPALCTARAAELATPLVFANTAASDRWADAAIHDVRGIAITAGTGTLTVTLRHRDHWDPWYAAIHRRAVGAAVSG
jgi:predicted amidohydrolase